MKKIKKPKYVWHLDDELYGGEFCRYEVLAIMRPNEHDVFFLCETETEEIYEDGTPAVWRGVFDISDDQLYPDNAKIRKLITEYNKTEKRRRELVGQIGNEWLPWLKRIGVMER